jgi:anti-anti-sigma factor
MQEIPAQLWKATPFTIERKEGKAPGTVIFRFCGPFTARDMFGTLAPVAIHQILSFQSTSNDEPPALNILDLTDVPYMDSSGLGKIVSHYVHCRGKGVRMIVAGMSPRVLELFKMTKVDSILPMSPTVEEVDA